MSLPPSSSIRTIQRRLVWTLIKAFLVVTVITLVVVLGSTLIQIASRSNQNPFYKSPSATILEAYYLGHGNWEGVAYLAQPGDTAESRFIGMEWNRTILLDQNGDVIMYYGRPFPAVPASSVEMPSEVNTMTLVVNGEPVGTLITDDRDIAPPVRMAVDIMNPIVWVSLVCAGVTLVIGILLMRRVVNPLSEVIAAAESVSVGNLKTRIAVRKSQDDLGSLVAHFNHMTETLEKNDTERRAMLADIAHELRTPLSVLRGRLEGIVDGVYTPNEVNIAQALEETYLLERLVEDLRLLTLAESRQLHFELKETNLTELLEKTKILFAPQAASKSIRLILDSKHPDAVALIDSQRMEQVIGNLIGNSLRYVPGGGRITLELDQNESSAVIKIYDNGPGVPEEEIPMIFERFWRGEKSRARVTGGAGLGLAISKQLIEAMGGKISAANRPEGGLETTITLPLPQTKAD